MQMFFFFLLKLQSDCNKWIKIFVFVIKMVDSIFFFCEDLSAMIRQNKEGSIIGSDMLFSVWKVVQSKGKKEEEVKDLLDFSVF